MIGFPGSLCRSLRTDRIAKTAIPGSTPGLARERLTGKYAAGAEAQLGALFGKKEPSCETTQWDRMKLNAERARASVDFEHYMNRIAGDRLRFMVWLTVAVTR